MANEANIIKIKRSGTSGAPASLKLGELAYSYLTASGNPTSNGGDRLFIGANGVNGGTGNANDVIVIGGKYFTDLLDHERGILTASSALIVDGNKKLDELLVDDLSLNGNTLSTTSGDLNVILSANGTGKVQINAGASSFTLPASRTGTTGYVLTANTDGTTSWAASASDFSLKAGTHTGDTGDDAIINLLTDDLEIRGDAKAISTALSKSTAGSNDHFVLEVKARYASTTEVGVATFNSDTFSVGIIGDVDVKSSGISNTQLANSSTYLGSTLLTLGDASGDNDTLAGLLSVTFDGSTSGTSVLQAQAVAGTTTFTLPTTTGTLVGTGDSGSVTNTMLADSTISGISLGNNLADLTVGTNLNLDSGTTYNGGTAKTINLDSALTGITSISASGGTGSVTLNNGTSNLTFDASGNLVLPNYTLPASSGTAGQVLIWPATGMSGVLEWADISTSFTVTGTTGPGETLDLLTDTFNTVGSDSNLSVAVTKDGTTVTSTITLASSLTGVSIDGSAGSVANALTFSDTGGVALNSTFNGSSAITIDYSSVGAAAVGQTFYIGTTAVTLNQTSGTVSSLAVDISGKATTAGTADSVANALTFAATGGVALNSTFNGSSATTIDYSSVGAAPKAGSSDIVTVGTLTSGSIGVGFTAIDNARLANSKVTVGTTDISLGSSSTTLAGLTQVDVNNIRVTGNTISSTNTDGDIIFDPNGTGTVNVSSARITNLADPTGAQDAATKAYVDATRSGLDVKDSVRAATIGNITLSNTQTVDGVALAVGNRVLVKNQDTASENGIYVVASGAWTRATDADNSPAGEVTSGMFAFVEQGTVNADSGWVLTTDGAITLGTTSLAFVQFSGAGQITAGDGLSKTGNRLDVNVANGIEISGDNVQLASSVAGNGLTYTSGVLDVVGTSDRISVSANAIDISTNYVGQNTITTLGTIGTGTWQASTLTYAYGGTGQTTWAKGDLLYASAANTLSKLTAGTNGQTLQLQDGLPVWADLDGGTY
jgi:hypothetical protein